MRPIIKREKEFLGFKNIFENQIPFPVNSWISVAHSFKIRDQISRKCLRTNDIVTVEMILIFGSKYMDNIN